MGKGATVASDRHRVTLHFHGHSVPARIDCVQSPEEARIDAAIDAWHESDTVLELHEYLGMTEEQYAAFVERCEVPRDPPILQRVESPAGPGATETAVRVKGATPTAPTGPDGAPGAILRDRSTPERAAFWDAALEASEEVAAWPEPRRNWRGGGL